MTPVQMSHPPAMENLKWAFSADLLCRVCGSTRSLGMVGCTVSRFVKSFKLVKLRFCILAVSKPSTCSGCLTVSSAAHLSDHGRHSISCTMIARQAMIYSRRVLGTLQPVCCSSGAGMASQAALARDEPQDVQASKKPLRKEIKKALKAISTEQMEAESEAAHNMLCTKCDGMIMLQSWRCLLGCR